VIHAKRALRSIPVVSLIARRLGRFVARVVRNTRDWLPDGPATVRLIGHRAYVGGLWDEIGKLQLDFMVANGLKPENYLLDIACGSLRAGVRFIEYLEPGHYLGIEKEHELLRSGVDLELGADTYAQKRPELVISGTFEFDKFKAQPNFAIAQSLFTHLPAPLIADCLRKLCKFIGEDGVFYATFSETAPVIVNPRRPHSAVIFRYTRREMINLGLQNGWSAQYLGEWGHPRGQKMVCYRPLDKAHFRAAPPISN
jgi:hypothetical protein